MEKVIFKNKEEFDIAEAKAYADFVKMARDAGYTIVRNNGKDEIIGKRLSDGVDMPDKKRITDTPNLQKTLRARMYFLCVWRQKM